MGPAGAQVLQMQPGSSKLRHRGAQALHPWLEKQLRSAGAPSSSQRGVARSQVRAGRPAALEALEPLIGSHMLRSLPAKPSPGAPDATRSFVSARNAPCRSHGHVCAGGRPAVPAAQAVRAGGRPVERDGSGTRCRQPGRGRHACGAAAAPVQVRGAQCSSARAGACRGGRHGGRGCTAVGPGAPHPARPGLHVRRGCACAARGPAAAAGAPRARADWQ